MSKKIDDKDVFREEVINVKLSEVLKKRAIISVPERIKKTSSGKKRLPDLIIGQFYGIRVIIEGRIGKKDIIRKSLETDCRRRLEEGLCTISIAVVYPDELRKSKDLEELEKNLESCEFDVKIFSEAGENEWSPASLKDLSQLIRRAYETIIKEDVVESSVNKIREAIEQSTSSFSVHEGTRKRLAELLISPKDE